MPASEAGQANQEFRVNPDLQVDYQVWVEFVFISNGDSRQPFANLLCINRVY